MSRKFNGMRNVLFGVLLVMASPSFLEAITFNYRVIDKSAGTRAPDVKAVGDIDGDGDEDVMIATKGGQVVVYENPSLTKHTVHTSEVKYSCHGEIRDINNDGDLDLVTTSWYADKHYWFENPGGSNPWGPWTRHRIGNVPLAGHDIEVADFDGDGKLDVVVRSEWWDSKSSTEGSHAQEVHVYRQNNPDSWSFKRLMANEGGGIATGDVDADGDPDILTNGHWFENPGSNIVAGTWAKHLFDGHCVMYMKARVADLNGDGRNDVVVGPSESNARGYKGETAPVSWYQIGSNAKSTWTKRTVGPNMRDLHSMEVADMDNDGDKDVFVAQMHHSPNKEVAVYVNNNNASSWTKHVVANTGSHEACVFDFEKDGDYDIVGCNYNSVKLEMWVNKTDPVIGPPRNGLVGYWAFDGSGETATDGSGNNHHGTISGAVRGAGRKGSALCFDGVDDKVDVPNHADLEITGDLTIAAWIKKQRANNGQRWDAILAKSPGKWDYELLTSKSKSDEPAFYSKAGVPNEVYGNSPILAGSWQHVAVTRSGNTVKFYLNGSLINTVTMSGAFPKTGGGLQIGFDGSAKNGMEGSIDEVYLYNRGLNGQEIMGVMGDG